MTLENKYLVVDGVGRVISRQEMFFVNTVNYLLYVVALDLKDNLGWYQY